MNIAANLYGLVVNEIERSCHQTVLSKAVEILMGIPVPEGKINHAIRRGC